MIQKWKGKLMINTKYKIQINHTDDEITIECALAHIQWADIE